MRWIKQLLFLMLIFVPGGPCVLSRDMAEGRLTLIQHPRAPYLVIFRAIWQSGSLRCGSRWGAAAPGSFWVSERTPSSVYWTLLLSWTVNKKKFVYPHWSMSAGLFLSQPSQRINTCPPSCWRAVGGFRQSGCGTPTGPEPTLPAGSPALSATHTHTHMLFPLPSLFCIHAGPESGSTQHGTGWDPIENCNYGNKGTMLTST